MVGIIIADEKRRLPVVGHELGDIHGRAAGVECNCGDAADVEGHQLASYPWPCQANRNLRSWSRRKLFETS